MSIEVHIDWSGQTHFAGHLHADPRSNRVSFEYDPTWLGRPDAFSIDPSSLPLRRGMTHGAMLFGAIQDCGPDRWGRILIERAVRKQVLAEKPYSDMDHVLSLNDATRIGALRFREGDGPFLAPDIGNIPPVIELGALLRAADAIHGETETARDLRFLLGAGSPLGGARPKAVVRLSADHIAIAKFPKPDDTRDIAAGEILAFTLARKAGIQTAEGRLIAVGRQNISVITRFDRKKGSRTPFISGFTLLGLPKDDPGAYTLLADGIRQFGDQIESDLHELWRRLVFSLLASNYDDHLRNHAFLMQERGRWSLAPAYDLNPVPEIERGRMNKTPVSEDDEEVSIDNVLAVAPRFALRPVEAKRILKQVFAAISSWRQTGRKFSLKATTLDAYASAFEHPLMKEAGRLVE